MKVELGSFSFQTDPGAESSVAQELSYVARVAVACVAVGGALAVSSPSPLTSWLAGAVSLASLALTVFYGLSRTKDGNVAGQLATPGLQDETQLSLDEMLREETEKRQHDGAPKGPRSERAGTSQLPA